MSFWLVAPLLYGFIVVTAWRVLTPHFAWLFTERYHYRHHCFTCSRRVRLPAPNGEMWFGALCLSLVIALVWPVAAVWLVHTPPVGAQARAKLRQQQDRIAQLEKETAIS